MFVSIWSVISCPLCQVVSERETEIRNTQEQSSKLQTELNRLRQELQEKTSQEEAKRQQMSEKEEKTIKAFLVAKQKISQLMGKKVPPHHKHQKYRNIRKHTFSHSDILQFEYMSRCQRTAPEG